MSGDIDHDRRRFLGAAAMTIAGARLGILGSLVGQSGCAAGSLPAEGTFSSLGTAALWLNTEPLTPEKLRGKVVLVDFGTYTCINWMRTLPYIRSWATKYKDQGLVVIGVHTPEFPFEKNLDSVRQVLRETNVTFPIAVDNEHAIWDSFNNEFWPALYLVDANGHTRYHHFGEGEYEHSERVIQQLLRAAGNHNVSTDLVEGEGKGAEAPADWGSLKSQETYLGYDRTTGFASPGGAATDDPRQYSLPTRLSLNQWALAGSWTIEAGAVTLNGQSGRIAYRFHARDVNLVMGPSKPGTSPRFRVSIDGQAAGAAHGVDIDANGNGRLSQQRMFQLIRQPKPIRDRQFEIEFPDGGAQAFCFTFG